MCLVTNWDKPEIAKEDIKAWKFIEKKDDKYESPYVGEPIVFDEMILDTDHLVIENEAVNKGLHGFTKPKYAQNMVNFFSSHLHRSNTVQLFVEMIIPAGAEYVISGDGEQIVSNKAMYKFKETN